jgi:hypothetical protein
MPISPPHFCVVITEKPPRPRRVGRAVDGTGLENRHTLTGIGGSNPSLSAIHIQLPSSAGLPICQPDRLAGFSRLSRGIENADHGNVGIER